MAQVRFVLYDFQCYLQTGYLTAAKSLQLCPTLCDPIDGSPPGSPVPGILQARTLEWVAISFSSACKWKVKVKSLSHVWLFATPWTAAFQAPPSMGFSRQEYWSGLPLPSSKDRLVSAYILCIHDLVNLFLIFSTFLEYAVYFFKLWQMSKYFSNILIEKNLHISGSINLNLCSRINCIKNTLKG